MPGDVIIRTERLCKDFGRLRAVDNLDMAIKRGQTFGFLGPNGAGKSTTIKMLTGFMTPTSGRIEIMGMDLVHNPIKVRERMGIVPDQFGFYPLMNADEHLAFYGKLYGMTDAVIKVRTEELLALVNLAERRKSRVGEYSHGMKQRLAIAQALLNEPDILFLDEPTTALDPQGQYETKRLINKLTRDGLTIFVSSHILSEVEEMCTHVGIVQMGRLVAQDSIDNLRRKLAIAKGIRVALRLSKPGDIRNLLSGMAGVKSVEQVSQYDFILMLDDRMTIPKISQAVACSELGLWSIAEMQSSLEQIFLELTGGGPR